MGGVRIAIGCDHAGYRLKEQIRSYLQDSGYLVTDFGTYSEESVDYPDFATQVAQSVAAGEHDFGILICSTGIGMSITANKVPGIRAGLCSTPDHGRLTREHNDANVLCLGQRDLDASTALEIVRVFLATPFGAGRHERRVNKIRNLDGVTSSRR